MRKTRVSSLGTLLALLKVLVCHALCTQRYLSVETTTLAYKGCYQESIYAGTYETKVWTMDGSDVAPSGTKAIVADLQNGDLADPSWVLGIVVSNPQNTWSDGYSAGLEVIEVGCRGTSAFWETNDPTEEIQWECDSNGDGVLSTAERGDFQSIDCGCPGIVEPTPTPAPLAAAIGGTNPPVQVPTPAPVAAVVTEPTAPPVPQEPAVQVTPAPLIGGPFSPTAPACNLTISSAELQDVSGCYVGQESSNARGKWMKADGSASIEWQDPTGSSEDGNWAVILTVFAGPGLTKCIGNEDVDDPTEIPQTRWYCDLTGAGEGFTPAVSFDFEGLQCSASTLCLSAAADQAFDEDSSDGSTGRTIGIAVGSVVAGVVVAAIICTGAVFVRKRRAKGTGAKPAEATEAGAPGNGDAQAPIPVFEPWGTRPAPRYYG